MTESSIGGASCQILILAPSRKWEAIAKRGRIDVYKNTDTGTFRLVGRNEENSTTPIDSDILPSHRYRKMTPKFVSWNDGQQAFGFQFYSSEDCDSLLLGFDAALANEGATRPEPARSDPALPPRRFQASAKPVVKDTAPTLSSTNPFAAMMNESQATIPQATIEKNPFISNTDSAPIVNIAKEVAPITSVFKGLPPRTPTPPASTPPPPIVSSVAPKTPASLGGGPPPPPPPPPGGKLGAPLGPKKMNLNLQDEIAAKKLKKAKPPASEPNPSTSSSSSASHPGGPGGHGDLMSDMANALARRRGAMPEEDTTSKPAKSASTPVIAKKVEPTPSFIPKTTPVVAPKSTPSVTAKTIPAVSPKAGSPSVTPKTWKQTHSLNVVANDNDAVTRAEFEAFKKEVLSEINKAKEEILAAIRQR